MTRRPVRVAAGYTLLNVLVAMFVAGLGLLTLVRSTVGMTAANTQNQMLASMAALGNGFWGVVQSTPAVLVTPALSGTTYTVANYASAPLALQPWLAQATQALPGAAITITTGPDAASGTACAVATGCAVTLEMDWTRVAVPGPSASAATRKQFFYYQFGL